MDLPEIETAAGTLRVALAPSRPSVRLVVLETDDGLLFPATLVVKPADARDGIWLAQVDRRISAIARSGAAADVAREQADAFLDHIRSLGGDAAWHFTNDDPDDMEQARESVVRGLAAALRFDDPYQATRSFERDVYFGSADIRMVDMFRSSPLLDRVVALAGTGEAITAAAAGLDRENLAKSQMIRAIAQDLREAWSTGSAPSPR